MTHKVTGHILSQAWKKSGVEEEESYCSRGHCIQFKQAPEMHYRFEYAYAHAAMLHRNSYIPCFPM